MKRGFAGDGFSVSAITQDTRGDVIVSGDIVQRGRDTIDSRWLLARYARCGVDPSFGSAGIVEGRAGMANAVGLERSGRIVVAGWSPPIRNGTPGGPGKAFMTARYVGGGEAPLCARHRKGH